MRNSYTKRMSKTDRNKEIGRRLSVGRLISHVDEVLPCSISWPKVCHSPFIYDANLIEKFIERLSGLVNRNNSRQTIQICRDPECTTKSGEMVRKR